MSEATTPRVLMVCMGNICRSPLAEGVLRHRAAEERLEVAVDSAGTYSYHAGSPPDSRAIEAAKRRGVDISAQRARRVSVKDFNNFDYILAMDSENLAALREMATEDFAGRLALFLDFAPRLRGNDVPDPYYGGRAGFEKVLDLVEEAVEGLLAELRRAPGRAAQRAAGND